MKNILIINGEKSFGHSKGALNHLLVDVAKEYLSSKGYSVDITNVDADYNIESEVQKWLWADVVIYQMPAWWMGPPWIIKKYIDEVFTTGHGIMYANDGRTRSDSSKKYGSGGLLNDKKYMLSVTWNAPTEAFEDSTQLFEGRGVDGVYFPVHKAHEFIGMSALPTFMCNDVIKAPEVDKFVIDYKNHLEKEF